MQLTRFDRWLLEEFVHETHIYTLSPPASLPRGVREVPVPEVDGRRYNHHLIATNPRAAHSLADRVAVLDHGKKISRETADQIAKVIQAELKVLKKVMTDNAPKGNAAKELVHIRGWLERVDEITQRGKETYLADALLQEAGDSLMMKLGEAANRLSRLGVRIVLQTRRA